MTATKSAVWIVEWEYNRSGKWKPDLGIKASYRRKTAIEKKRIRESGERANISGSDVFRYRVRRYIREESK